MTKTVRSATELNWFFSFQITYLTKDGNLRFPARSGRQQDFIMPTMWDNEGMVAYNQTHSRTGTVGQEKAQAIPCHALFGATLNQNCRVSGQIWWKMVRISV